MRTECAAQNGLGFVEEDRDAEFPGWVPAAARNYLAHVEGGQTIRALAREAQVHPSTILRQVRRMEVSRDDPLVDSALRQLAGRGAPAEAESAFLREALPVLRRLSEPEAVLAVARDMEMGAVLREGPDGEPPVRLAVVARALAEAMALRDWIAGVGPAKRIRRYEITTLGRAELRRAESGRGFAEAPARFLRDEGEAEDPHLRHLRSALGESPLQGLARRRDEKGRPFLTRDHVAAGERLREDFEIVARAEGLAPDWDVWLERLPDPAEIEEGGGSGAEAARLRVERALADLGPGLADVALRCCCQSEGLEPFERRMGWSARSGKVVLRIALGRLDQHYRAEAVRKAALIGQGAQARPATRPRR